MELDLVDLYGRASAWTVAMVPPAKDQLDAPTPCEQWDVRTLLNHMLQTQHYFRDSAQGKDAELTPNPPELIGNDPVSRFETARADMLRVFGAHGVVDQTGPMLGIAFSDMLLHGWDLAQATGQDATMPEGLPEAAYQMIHGRFTDEQRKGVFAPEVEVGRDASAQDRLLAYTGRDPAG